MDLLKTQAEGSKKKKSKTKKIKLERDINPSFHLREKIKIFNNLNVVLTTYDTYMGVPPTSVLTFLLPVHIKHKGRVAALTMLPALKYRQRKGRVSK